MANRLAGQHSLYLRQHADNPVDWHPWDAAALARARNEHRPILLSIGYSACHWCHVMAHESFEDPATADVMNALFVNIKVDREERPDLDRIYQLAHQALARRGGGWPLTVFLTPDTLLPFYAGTYFPPQARHGLPAFADVVRGVRRWFDEQPQQVADQNAALAEFLADHGRGDGGGAPPDAALLDAAQARIASGFDAENGGHRGGPKFPPAPELGWQLRRARDGDAGAAAMARTTLRRMAERGLHDHVGGGFYRYCVDAHWGIPHFEKMLYDNAALLALYADAAAIDDEAEFVAAADGIVGWLQRDMRIDGGGYASALDADSEGEEGRYYVWTPDEVRALLPAETRDAFCAAYGLAGAPNFEGHAWHLQRRAPLDASTAFVAERSALRHARDARVPPARDDKCLTAWNAMLARALARGALRLQRDAWLPLADAILDRLRTQAWRDGRLYALAHADAGIGGFLDDHAFLLDALLARLEAGWLDADAAWAGALADILLREFEDRDAGGFHFTPHAHEPLPQRPKPWFDESTPSGNGVAAGALLRLGLLLGETRWIDAAERTLRAAMQPLRDAPQGACTLLSAAQEWLQPSPVIVLRASAEEAPAWADAWHALRLRGASAYVVPPTAQAFADKPHRAGGAAYVCVGMRCLAAVTRPEQLRWPEG